LMFRKLTPNNTAQNANSRPKFNPTGIVPVCWIEACSTSAP